MSSEKQGEKAPLTGQPPPTYSGAAPVVVQPVVVQPVYHLNEPMPPDYLLFSILTLLFCFWPLSLFALIKSLEVRSSYQNGRYQDSVSASMSALKFNRLSILVGILIWVIVALCQLGWIIPTAIRY